MNKQRNEGEGKMNTGIVKDVESEDRILLMMGQRVPVLMKVQSCLNYLRSILSDFPKGCMDEEYLTGLATTLCVNVLNASSNCGGATPNFSKILENLNERYGNGE